MEVLQAGGIEGRETYNPIKCYGKEEGEIVRTVQDLDTMEYAPNWLDWICDTRLSTAEKIMVLVYKTRATEPTLLPELRMDDTEIPADLREEIENMSAGERTFLRITDLERDPWVAEQIEKGQAESSLRFFLITHALRSQKYGEEEIADLEIARERWLQLESKCSVTLGVEKL